MADMHDPFTGTGIEDVPARPPEPLGGPEGTRILVRLPSARQLYTYWVQGPVKVNDRVEVPGPPWAPQAKQAGTVAAIGSDYEGPVKAAYVIR